jgi:hypothetical protein
MSFSGQSEDRERTGCSIPRSEGLSYERPDNRVCWVTANTRFRRIVGLIALVQIVIIVAYCASTQT